MKISRNRQGERGMAVIVVMTLLSIILIFVAGNLRTLHNLGRDLKLVEQRKLRYWQKAAATNSIASTNSQPTKAKSALVAKQE